MVNHSVEWDRRKANRLAVKAPRNPRCTSTIKERASSSTTRKVGPYVRKPLSTIPMTFISARTCATCPRYGASAFKPIDDYFRYSASATIASSPKKPFKKSIVPYS
jgi:hypothetical protein